MTNHSENTPGYPFRLQVLFTLRDGVLRAWSLSPLGLVPQPVDAARRWVKEDLADEISIAVDEQAYGRPVASKKACCASCAEGKPCEGAVAAAIDVAVVGTQTTNLAFAGRGRLVAAGEPWVGEPLFAVAEPDGNRVACCGGACGESAATPNAIVFDHYAATEGGYAVRDSHETALPAHLRNSYVKRAPSCLPWVRVTRSPEKFRGCLAAARALGPIKNSKAVADLVGEYLMQQDQEIFLVVLLDTQLHVRGISEVARGSRDRVEVPVPDVLRVALVDGAKAAVVVHNHPSAVNRPSETDIELTKTLHRAFKEVQLDLMDHVIIAGDKRYSFLDHGRLGK